VADPIKPNQSGLPPPKLAQAVRETAKDFAKEAIFEKRPYLKQAFSNPYNLSLLGGALAASVLTLNPRLALGAPLTRLIAIGVFMKTRIAILRQFRHHHDLSDSDVAHPRVG